MASVVLISVNMARVSQNIPGSQIILKQTPISPFTKSLQKCSSSVLLYDHATETIQTVMGTQDGHRDFHTASAFMLLNVHGGEMAY